MLHIGHFSFDGREAENGDRHGYFTCIVDAPDPEAAASAFAGQIVRLRRTGGPFAQMVRVYLEDIVRVPQVPAEPIVTLVQSSEGRFPPSVSHSLFGVEGEEYEAFGVSANVERQEGEDTGDGYVVPDPFVTFEDTVESPPEPAGE